MKKSLIVKNGTFAHKDIAFEFASWISAIIQMQSLSTQPSIKKLK